MAETGNTHLRKSTPEEAGGVLEKAKLLAEFFKMNAFGFEMAINTMIQTIARMSTTWVPQEERDTFLAQVCRAIVLQSKKNEE